MKKEKPGKKEKIDAFTSTEVGALVESFRFEIRGIAEGNTGLDKRLENVEIEVHGNSRRLDMLEITWGAVNGKVSRLEDAVSKLSKDLRDTRQELGETRRELKVDIARVNQNLESKIDNLGNRLTAVEARR